MMETQSMEMDVLQVAQSSRALVALDNLQSVHQDQPAEMAFWMVENNVTIVTLLMEMVAVIVVLLSPDFFVLLNLVVHAIPSVGMACSLEENFVMTTTQSVETAAQTLA